LFIINSILLISSIDKAHIQTLNASFESLDNFIEACLLSELVRFNISAFTNLLTYLAINIGKDGVTHLLRSASESRTVKDLLDSRYFKKNSQNNTIVYLVFKKVEEVPSYALPEFSSPIKPKIKREKKEVKKEVKKERKIKLEATQEVSYERRKRGISQVTDA
jgi:hypothetical protein